MASRSLVASFFVTSFVMFATAAYARNFPMTTADDQPRLAVVMLPPNHPATGGAATTVDNKNFIAFGGIGGVAGVGGIVGIIPILPLNNPAPLGGGGPLGGLGGGVPGISTNGFKTGAHFGGGILGGHVGGIKPPGFP